MAKIWLTVLLLTLVVGGCRRAPGEAERRLMAIDSLVAVAPDSALALLADIDTATLAEPDRAYFALLQTQAMYKAGIPVDDSTLICRAQHYYADHGPVDRQIRTMSYRASVAEDLGDPELAMRWYKRTELAARDHGDDYNTGYALMSMGVLYQSNFEWRHSVDKYRQADSLFTSIDPKCAMFCKQQLAKLYRDASLSADSAMWYIDAVINTAKSNHDTVNLVYGLQSKVAKFFFDSDYGNAKRVAVETIEQFGDYAPFDCWQFASQSFSEQGVLDSAVFYLNNSPAAQTPFDSSLIQHSLTKIHQLKGNIKLAQYYQQKCDSIDESLRFGNELTSLAGAEKEIEKSKIWSLMAEHSRGTRLGYSFIGLFAVACLILIFGLIRTRKEQTKAKQELNNLRNLIAQSEYEMSRIRSLHTESALRVTTLEQELTAKLQEIECLRQPQQKAESTIRMLEEEITQINDEIQNLRKEQADAELFKSLFANLNASFNNVVTSMGNIADDYYHNGRNARVFMKHFQENFQQSWIDQDFWKQIEEHINRTHDNALARLMEHHSGITERDKHLLMLTILGFSASAIAVCLKYSNPKVTSVMRNKLKARLHTKSSLKEYLNTFRNPER